MKHLLLVFLTGCWVSTPPVYHAEVIRIQAKRPPKYVSLECQDALEALWHRLDEDLNAAECDDGPDFWLCAYDIKNVALANMQAAAYDTVIACMETW